MGESRQALQNAISGMTIENKPQFDALEDGWRSGFKADALSASEYVWCKNLLL